MSGIYQEHLSKTSEKADEVAPKSERLHVEYACQHSISRPIPGIEFASLFSRFGIEKGGLLILGLLTLEARGANARPTRQEKEDEG